MPYFELDEKFWEIENYPKKGYVLVRYGKKDHDGVSRRYHYFKDSWGVETTKKLTDEKIAKGYKLVKGISTPKKLEKYYDKYIKAFGKKTMKVKKALPKNKTVKKECPEGKRLNESTGRCVKVKVEKKKECPEGKRLNESTGRCVKVKVVKTPMVKVEAKVEVEEGQTLWDVKKQGVMLSHTFKDQTTGKITNPPKGFDKAPNGWWLSEKYDGYRAIWDGQNFRSRVGNIFEAPNEFKSWMPKDIALDGELFAGREKFEKCGLFRKKEPCSREWREAGITYQIFDAPGIPAPFEERMEVVKRVIKERCALKIGDGKCPLKLTNQVKVKDETEVMKKFEEFTSKGAEGVMLRAPKSPYEPKRSRFLLKVKPLFDTECTIIGHKKGTGKYEDMLGAFECKMDNGKVFHMSGMDDTIRKEYKKTHPVGTRITFTYMGLTSEGTPRHPNYLRKRETRD